MLLLILLIHLNSVAALQEYFEYFGLSLTVTMVRKMEESAMFVALQQGNVSLSQYENSLDAQGHSRATGMRHYRISAESTAKKETAYATLMGDDESSDRSTIVTQPLDSPLVSASECTVLPLPVLQSHATGAMITLSTPSPVLLKRTLEERTPELSKKRVLADKVAAQTARQDIIRRVVDDTQDGCLHPWFVTAKKKIPASDSERTWLFNYFTELSTDLCGNYYRYMILLIFVIFELFMLI
jgi:hypothetical protein